MLVILSVASLLLWTTSAPSQSVEEDETETLQATTRPGADEGVDPSEVVEMIVQQTNEFRDEQDRQKVQVNSNLTETAQYFAKYMARTDQYGHRADGNRPSERAEEHGYEYCLVSENIAYQYSSAGFTNAGLAQRFVEGWKNSPRHRENMLEPAVLETGVAVARSDETGNWYAVQMFGRPKSAIIEFRVANRSDSTANYTIGDRTFPLPPGYTRIHQRCWEMDVSFDFPEGEGKSEQVQPTSGDHYVIVRDNGQLDVQQE
jgi:uncharacterized protein YkwD